MADKWKVKPPEYVKSGKRLDAAQRASLLGEPAPHIETKTPKELGEVSALNFQCKFRDAEKQERYDRYCNNIKLGKLDPYAGLAPDGATDWEVRKEKAEFERAATQKSTITAIMASRFKRANFKDSDTNVELTKTKVLQLYSAYLY